MTSPRVFVVTGSNKGIGRSIVKLLLQDKEEKIVYLTSRNEELGLKTVKELEEKNLKASFHQLDITDQSSINKLKDHLSEKHGGLDVLVNNAGIAYKGSSTAPFAEQAEVTVNCNFFGTLNVCDALFPLLRPNARVVHVSSLVSEYAFKALSPEMKAKFGDEDLTIEGLKGLINEFIVAAKEDKVKERGFATTAYGMSKVGESIMTIIQQKMFDQESEKRNIIVNACCPGLVDTDMTGGKYPNAMPPDEGADTPTFLALLPLDATEPKGKFCKLRKPVTYPSE